MNQENLRKFDRPSTPEEVERIIEILNKVKARARPLEPGQSGSAAPQTQKYSLGRQKPKRPQQ